VIRPEVSIVVVSYNTKGLLRRCLETVARSGTSRACEVIVVDNASVDGSPGMLSRDFPDVRLMANGENVGYSRAVNQAIRSASGRYVLILNPDIEVGEGAIDALARHMDENPATGIAGGKLLNPDGTLQYSCRTFYTFATLLHRRTPLGKIFPNSGVVRRHLMLDWDHESVREVDWMLGACLMVRRDAIRDVGLMDERFFMYFEDVDWCYRMKQHGWKVVYVPDARMKHVHQRESAKGAGIFNRRIVAHLNSMFRFFDKWNTLLYRMRKHRDLTLGGMLLLGDVVGVSAAFFAAFGLRTLLGSVLQRPVFPLAAYQPFLLLAAGVVLTANALLGLYRRPTARDLLDDAFDLGKGLLLSALVLMASTFLTRSELHSRLMVALFVPFAFLAMLLARSVPAWIAGRLRSSRFGLVRVLVVGDRDVARALAERLGGHPRLGYEVVATLPDRPGEEERRFREFWDAEGIREVMLRHRVGEVLLVRPTLSDRELARFVLLCRRDGVRLRLVSGAADFLPGRLDHGELLGRPTVELSAMSGLAGGRILRRLQDVSLSLAALALLGPVLWMRAARRPSADVPHDTVYGRGGVAFRRRSGTHGLTRLAETLGHVLRGELALVGPRPASPDDVAASEELRLLFDLARPGATGPWRLRVDDGGLEPDEEVSGALAHLQNQTLVEDLKVILRTLAAGRHPSRSSS
jgi:GT2 family glycosyltransferase